MKIEAIFIGKDGSCGYIHNMLYTLNLSSNSYNCIIIQREDNSGMCVYSTLSSMLNNWRNLNLKQ